MKELSIGEEIRIRCVESKDSYCCDKCVFNPGDNPCMVEYVCDKGMRKDYTNVHFELVENSDLIDLPTDEEICAYSSMFYTGSAVHYVREGMRRMKKMIEEKLNKIE